MTRTIVLADDDDDLRAVLAPRLRAFSFEVWEARDGLEAIDLVRRHRPELLVLDLWMPKLDGLKVLEALRFDALSGSLSVVMLSAFGASDGRLESYAAGAAGFVVKGGSIDELARRLAAWADDPNVEGRLSEWGQGGFEAAAARSRPGAAVPHARGEAAKPESPQ